MTTAVCSAPRKELLGLQNFVHTALSPASFVAAFNVKVRPAGISFSKRSTSYLPVSVHSQSGAGGLTVGLVNLVAASW